MAEGCSKIAESVLETVLGFCHFTLPLSKERSRLRADLAEYSEGRRWGTENYDLKSSNIFGTLKWRFVLALAKIRCLAECSASLSYGTVVVV